MDGKPASRSTRTATGRLVVQLATPRRRRASLRGRGRATAADPGPCPSGDGEMGWEELADGVIVAGPAARRALVVPVQRPAGRQGDAIASRSPSPPPTTWSPTARSVERRRGRARRRGRTSSPSRWRRTSPRSRSAVTSTRRARVAGADAVSCCPAGRARPAVDAAFGRQPRDDGAVRRGSSARTRSRATPPWSPRTSSRSRSRRRACRPSAQLPDRRLGQRAAGRPRALPPVVRQQPDRRRTGATSGCTRGSRATPSGCGPRSRAGPSADERAAEHWRAPDGLPQDLLLGDPGPDAMFDDRVYKRGALLLHALRRTVGDEAFFTILRTWADRTSTRRCPRSSSWP